MCKNGNEWAALSSNYSCSLSSSFTTSAKVSETEGASTLCSDVVNCCVLEMVKVRCVFPIDVHSDLFITDHAQTICVIKDLNISKLVF
jgi:hypothetical protein